MPKGIYKRIKMHFLEPKLCIYNREETVRNEREKLIRLFKKRELRNPVTRKSFIDKLHQLYLKEKYLRIPNNLIIKIK